MDPIDRSEIKAAMARIESRENNANVDQYFSPSELTNICAYEKVRLQNVKMNYLMLMEFGIPIAKPYFMQKKGGRKKKVEEPVTDSDSDEDWTPAVERRKEIRKSGRLPMQIKRWEPPSKLLQVEKDVLAQQKKEKKAEATMTKADLEAESTTDKKAKADNKPKASASASATPSAHLVTTTKRRVSGANKWERFLPHEQTKAKNKMLNSIMAKGSTKRKQKVAVDEAETKQESDNEEQDARYPKRSIPKTNYSDLEVPDDDFFLHCDDCNQEYPGDCPVHGPLNIIHDKEVSEDDPEKADHSLPDGLAIGPSGIRGAGLGAWTETKFPRGTRFGPYLGIRRELQNKEEARMSGYSWQLNSGERVSHFIDAQQKEQSNWMRYVNCARTEEEQNLVAFQYRGEIYYKTTRELAAYCELLVWYGDSYGQDLGIKKLKSQGNHEVQEITGYKCEKCGALFSVEEALCRHQLNKHPDRSIQKRHRCPHCQYSTDIITNLTHHLVTHTGEHPCKCDICGRTFTHKGNLNKHKRIHTGEKPYKCPHCTKAFTESRSFTRHIRTVHERKQDYKCDTCGAKFTQSSNLNKHKKLHTGGKPHRCQHCGKRFMHKQNLQTHVRTHTGEKPYCCKECDARFTKSSNLRVHERRHHGECPHKCHFCDKAFAASTELKYHIITAHTKDYPYNCDVCQRGFVTPGELRKHVKSKHEEE